MLKRLYSTLSMVLAALLIFSAMPLVVSAGTLELPAIVEVGTVLKTSIFSKGNTMIHLAIDNKEWADPVIFSNENIKGSGGFLATTTMIEHSNLFYWQNAYIADSGLPILLGAS